MFAESITASGSWRAARIDARASLREPDARYTSRESPLPRDRRTDRVQPLGRGRPDSVGHPLEQR